MVEEEFEYAERKNKKAEKRELYALRTMAKTIMGLPDSTIETFPLDERLIIELIGAKKMKKGALRRQMLLLERLIRKEDEATVSEALEKHLNPHRESVELFHQLETWRDDLIANKNEVVEQLVVEYPAFDRQHVRQLVRNTTKEMQLKKPPKSSRALFKYLKEICC
ncbi:MAG: DUF615 domain-containing protein [Thiotrichaceae bacterium]|nr:DUF615 domain-containing protein [Thiotrichaceae bacterium]